MTDSILIIDDEPAIAHTLGPVLSAQGYMVEIAATASEGLAKARTRAFTVVLLDLGLPDADGKDIIATLHALSALSVIVLSARHQEAEKVAALDAGAEDYVDKPFCMEELLARIRAAVRRMRRVQLDLDEFRSRDLQVNYLTRQVRLLGEEIKLSPKEFDLLEVLTRHAGQVVTHRRLLIAGWKDPATDGQYLRSYVGLLRQKLEVDPAEPTLIITEPGVGYRLDAAAA